MFSRFVRISQRRFLIAKIVLLLSLLGSPSVYAGDLVKLTVVNTCNCAILSAGHEAVVQIGESAKPFNLPVGGKQVLELSKGTYLFTVSVKGHKTIRQNIYLNEDGFVEIDSVGSISLEFKKFGTETW